MNFKIFLLFALCYLAIAQAFVPESSDYESSEETTKAPATRKAVAKGLRLAVVKSAKVIRSGGPVLPVKSP